MTQIYAAEGHVRGMAFEGVMLCRDIEVFISVDRLLSQYLICTILCFTADQALDQLKKSSTDLLVVDCDGEESSELLYRLWKSDKWKEPTILAITSGDAEIAGAHVVLTKPFTTQTASQSVRAAYSRMLLDFRPENQRPSQDL